MELVPFTPKRPLNIKIVEPVAADLEELREWLKNNTVFGLDTETNWTKEYFTRKIRVIQIGNHEKQFVIDLKKFHSDLLSQGDYGYLLGTAHHRLIELIEILKEPLESKQWLKVGANLGFEYEMFWWNFGIRADNFFSIDVVERVIKAGELNFKQYSLFSLESLMARYFGVQIDKSLQESFNLTDDLTDAQIQYAALDTVLPLAVMRKQLPIIKKDGLEETCQIENDAISSFVDMHLNGMKINREKWAARLNDNKMDLNVAIAALDTHFIPYVGTVKDFSITEDDLVRLEREWKKALGEDRKEKRQIFYEARRKRKDWLNQAAACQGSALINYDSPEQVLNVLHKMPGLGKLIDTNDDTLKVFKDIPVLDALKKYRKLCKLIDTYGESWITEWRIKPGGDVESGEGWLWPNDGRLHSKFNQLDAETGRSTSSNPNGQNLPHDPEIRACFEASAPGMCILTADMSGAELRIIAELANAKSWIDAFNRGEDVHSVGCEILFPKEWPELALPDCKYYKLKADGTPQRKKCSCPGHKKLRDNNKSTNFLLAYGGTENKLAREIDSTKAEAKKLMELHSHKFPDIWKYLDESGKRALITKEARDMFGRRRKFPLPTFERAEIKVKRDNEKKLRHPKSLKESLIKLFEERYGRKPEGKANQMGSEMWICSHRSPTSDEIANARTSMEWGIERAGKNHCIQGSNASIAKLAMGSGNDKEGKPYLWRVFPLYNARLLAFVHDEFVVECPKKNATIVTGLIGDAIRRAAATKMKKVIMEFECKADDYWVK